MCQLNALIRWSPAISRCLATRDIYASCLAARTPVVRYLPCSNIIRDIRSIPWKLPQFALRFPYTSVPATLRLGVLYQMEACRQFQRLSRLGSVDARKCLLVDAHCFKPPGHRRQAHIWITTRLTLPQSMFLREHHLDKRKARHTATQRNSGMNGDGGLLSLDRAAVALLSMCGPIGSLGLLCWQISTVTSSTAQSLLSSPFCSLLFRFPVGLGLTSGPRPLSLLD